MNHTFINPTVPRDDHVLAWIDRIGEIAFISDQKFGPGDKLNEGTFLLSIRVYDAGFEHATTYL